MSTPNGQALGAMTARENPDMGMAEMHGGWDLRISHGHHAQKWHFAGGPAQIAETQGMTVAHHPRPPDIGPP